jgi:eukaryotic-like serine/threonine-protein kinase
VWTGIAQGTRLVASLSGTGFVADEMLGEGGQGQVWRVRSADGRALALKWYFPASATDDQRAALDRLVRRGSPDARFLWPLDLVEGVHEAPGFGYLMELRPSEYHSMMALMQRRIEPGFAALAGAGAEMADAFLRLHSQGLCYLDISFGNVFLEPDSGSVLICDNDNVRIDGRPAGVAGTPKFMAPEVLRDLAAGRYPTPNRSTDLFSLAVLLFYMFVMHHPFEGAKEAAIEVFDAEAQNRLYGEAPVFIFHPDDDTNRPDPDLHPNPLAFWPLYPDLLRDLFVRSFTVGVDRPDERVQESEWRLAMIRLRDSIAACPACEAENFLAEGAPDRCWHCGQGLPYLPRLALGDTNVVLGRGARLFPHHTAQGAFGYGEPMGEVVAHPERADVWGLRNLGSLAWTVISPDGGHHVAEPGQTARILDGTIIEFGGRRGRTGTIVGDPPA